MSYSEDDLLPISGLPQLVFCERRCALMHVEGVWNENRFTALGRIMHEQVHEGSTELRDGILITRSLLLRSLRLGLSGIADVVEFHPVEQGGVSLPGRSGLWQPFPVEYKRGKPKWDHSDEVQLCAQAICLEEMLHLSVTAGALYYGEPRRRTPVYIGPELRAETEQLAAQFHELIRQGVTPKAVRESRCRHCSLLDLCLPTPRKTARSASRYLRQMITEAQQPSGVINYETDA